MNTECKYEQAIGQMERCYSGCAIMNFDNREFVDFVISVLHTQQEQEKGCEYCDFSSGDVGAVINNMGDAFVLIKNDDYVVIATDDKHFETLKINDCPICGRNLEPKEAQR